MWPGGRICSNCALARKRSAQSDSTAWIFTGVDGELEGCTSMLDTGELGEGGVLSQEQGVLYYFGNTRTRHLLMRAPCLWRPAVI